jgi:DNA-binding winged helix-turn-helix (wHTH) protein
MSQIQLDPSTLSVTWNNSTATLLPKEFALFEYLLLNKGVTLSREQLLDAVWSMESPTDRTVDDHIYRLRKKLHSWQPSISIETVRGLGYRLQMLSSPPRDNPLVHNSVYKEDMQEISDMYLRYGRGDALLTLSKNKDIFGFELNSPLQVIVKLMDGDIGFLMEDEDTPIEVRLFTLLYLNQMIDPAGNRKFVEAALQTKFLSPVLQNELELMIIPSMLMDWGDYEEARHKLEFFALKVEQENWDGLVPFVNNMKLEYDFHTENWTALAQDIRTAEEQWHHYPYQREKGQLLIFKGLSVYPMNPKEAMERIREGITIITETHFITHLLKGLRTILYFSDRFGWQELYAIYKREWDRHMILLRIETSKDQIGIMLNSFFRAQE